MIYNWGSDAYRWTGMSDKDRVIRVIADLEKVYSKLCKDPSTFNVQDYLMTNENGSY